MRRLAAIAADFILGASPMLSARALSSPSCSSRKMPDATTLLGAGPEYVFGYEDCDHGDISRRSPPRRAPSSRGAPGFP